MSLRDTFTSNYSLDGLTSGIYPEKFMRSLDAMSKIQDNAGFGVIDVEAQRDLTLKFHWGHNHPLNDTRMLYGRMGWAHCDVLEQFLELTPGDLKNPDREGLMHSYRVLDVGCWTGGTTLALIAAGFRDVEAVEEVNKYVYAANYLINSFKKSRGKARAYCMSAYDVWPNRNITSSAVSGPFDLVYMPGVIYHVSDPICLLRIMYDALFDGGELWLESEIVSAETVVGPWARLDGRKAFRGGSKQDLNRGGWNWWIPTDGCLTKMCEEVGFTVMGSKIWNHTRQLIVARREGYKPMLKSGLSIKRLRR